MIDSVTSQFVMLNSVYLLLGNSGNIREFVLLERVWFEMFSTFEVYPILPKSRFVAYLKGIYLSCTAKVLDGEKNDSEVARAAYIPASLLTLLKWPKRLWSCTCKLYTGEFANLLKWAGGRVDSELDCPGVESV